MPLVNVMVNGRAYTLGCDDGEEEHLKDLAARVDAKAREAVNMVGQSAGDAKLMLMAALLLADEHHETAPAPGQIEDPEVLRQRAQQAETIAAQALDGAAGRMEDLAARLAH